LRGRITSFRLEPTTQVTRNTDGYELRCRLCRLLSVGVVSQLTMNTFECALFSREKSQGRRKGVKGIEYDRHIEQVFF
jgi:hypothetical protein